MANDDTLFEEDEALVAEEDVQEVARLVAELEKRCKSAGITITRETAYDGEVYSKINIPSGRDNKTFFAWHNKDRLNKFLNSDFENCICISGFEAIYNKKTKIIEAEFRPTTAMPSHIIRQRIYQDNGEKLTLQPSAEEMPTIELGISSTTFDSLSSGLSSSKKNVIRIFDVAVSQHNSVKELLIKIANAVFFQMDLIKGIPLILVRDRRSSRMRRGVPRKPDNDDIKYPDHEYDQAPMSLYWYAKSAIGMPLLRFLAYYQAIEFYFPTYHQAEANRKIKAVLKDPAFRPEKDTHVAKIIAAIHSGRPGGGNDERSQLKATMNECVTSEGIRDFILQDDERKKFLSSKTKGLTDKAIPVATASADLRNEVAERIYEIRCKIVHTKGDSGELELLLPYSKEAELLYHDIDLLEYITKQVLISASTHLTLPSDSN